MKETLIRWYTGYDAVYTIKELKNCRSNTLIEGLNLDQIIQHVIKHGSFNPISSANGKKRFGIDIKLISKGDDAKNYEE